VSVRTVLQVIPSVGPLRGGPSAVVRQLASNLATAGIESHVATTNDNGPGTLDVGCGIPVADAGATYWFFPRQLAFYTFSWPLAEWLRRHTADYDIVHIHALFSWAALPASYWACYRDVPYVVRPLGTLNTWGMENRRPWVKASSYRLIESRVVAHAALMHYTSEQERIEAESLGITTRGAVIPNALATSTPAAKGAFRSRYSAIAGRQVVLFLSRIDPKKGVDLLLHAMVDVSRTRDAVLVIAGDYSTPHGGDLKQLAASLGIGERVIWTGFLHGDSKAAALADADVFVLPSHSENFGIAVAEAMAAGVPVVVSDQVAISTDVAAADAGMVVRCDAAQLAAAIVGLLSDAQRRFACGTRGRELAASRYSQDAITRQVIGVYNQLLR
jgi:glycosyltransferase involved in cell wall biosynthesis